MYKFHQWKDTITSDEGVTIQMEGQRCGLKYTDTTGTYVVDSEREGPKPVYIMIYSWGIYRLDSSGNKDGKVDDVTRERIVRNIHRAFEGVGLVVKIF